MKGKLKKTRVILVRLSESDRKRLDRISKRLRISRAQFIRELIFVFDEDTKA